MTAATAPPASHPIVAFAAEVLRFPLRPRQAAILAEIYCDGIRTAVLRLGRRSGKGRIAAVVATFEGTVNAASHLAAVPAGEQVAIVVVATTQRQARIVHRFIRGFLRTSPDLERLVKRETADEIELTNGIVIMTLPAHAASARGMAIAVVILDEAAHFYGRDGSPLDVGELWDALVPSTLDFADARIVVTSTPKWSIGWFADLCRQAASGQFADMRHWHATTAEMREGESRVLAALEQERAKDPVTFAREYEAAFDQALQAVFDAELVRLACRAGDPELKAQPGVAYLVAVDGAAVGDHFAVAVGHLEWVSAGRGRVVIDRVRDWRGSRTDPVRIDPTLDAVAELSRAYGHAPVVIDQWMAWAIRGGLAARGVEVLERPWTNQGKLAAAVAVRQALYQGALELPPVPTLVAELSSLEQRPTPGGRPRIAAAGGGHDDQAHVVLAIVGELVASAEPDVDESDEESFHEFMAAAAISPI